MDVKGKKKSRVRADVEREERKKGDEKRKKDSKTMAMRRTHDVEH